MRKYRNRKAKTDIHGYSRKQTNVRKIKTNVRKIKTNVRKFCFTQS